MIQPISMISESICAQDFINGSPKSELPFFLQTVIESARTGTEVQGMYYNSLIESQHFREKRSSPIKKNLLELEEIVRKQDDKVRAIYESGLYRLSAHYAKSQMDSVKWHSLEKRNKHVSLFRQHIPIMEQEFKREKREKSKRKSLER